MGGFGLDIISNALAGKPSIPAWNTIDLGQQQTKAISENTASLPGLENLATQSNTFSLQQLQSMLTSIIPGYSDITAGVSKDISSMVSGQIPTDVSNQVQDNAAAKSLTGGFGGSGLSGNLTARDLGLTSLNLMGEGISSAESWLSTVSSIASPQMFNMSSMFVTPQQQFTDTMENQTQQFQRDYVSNLNDWQHSLGYAAGQDVMNTGNTLLSMFSGIMGGGSSNSGDGASG
jgi:hypothetical protein